MKKHDAEYVMKEIAEYDSFVGQLMEPEPGEFWVVVTGDDDKPETLKTVAEFDKWVENVEDE